LTQINPSVNTDPHLTQALENAKIFLQRFSGHEIDPRGQKVAPILVQREEREKVAFKLPSPLPIKQTGEVTR
jgi:hypothetical protein